MDISWFEHMGWFSKCACASVIESRSSRPLLIINTTLAMQKIVIKKLKPKQTPWPSQAPMPSRGTFNTSKPSQDPDIKPRLRLPHWEIDAHMNPEQFTQEVIINQINHWQLQGRNKNIFLKDGLAEQILFDLDTVHSLDSKRINAENKMPWHRAKEIG